MGDGHDKAEFTIYSYSNQIPIYFSCTVILKDGKGTVFGQEAVLLSINCIYPKMTCCINTEHALEY